LAIRVIPVLDVKHGQVVRGVGGRRAEYPPLVSRLTTSTEPVAVAEAVRRTYGLTEFYVADLDAIAGAPPALNVYAQLRALGFQLWVDAGIRSAADAEALNEMGLEHIIAGLETLESPSQLTSLYARCGADRIVFSLDLKDGKPVASFGSQAVLDAWSIAETAIAVGTRRILVLDLARVGTGEGAGTEEFCSRLTHKFPHLGLAAGGGLRDARDLVRFERSGVQAVLVASALHEGRISPGDIAALSRGRGAAGYVKP
jgi:phosphoribosylformimino-5-aminoimidazole carboxamide ribotide isomerase